MRSIQSPLPHGVSEAARDPRWHALSMVQTAREHFTLRDRDIAVLRGLLSLVTAEAWESGNRIAVYASNKTLSERCDGMEERTLRRRLAKLCESGLIQRHMSPNRKRYSLRDASGAVLISYGFDLAPLREAVPNLEHLAYAAQQTAAEIKALRGVLRHHLWLANENGELTCPTLRNMLRNKTTVEDLQNAISGFNTASEAKAVTDKLSGSDEQTVRDIQNSYKEYLIEDAEMDLRTTLEQVPNALSYAPEKLETWHQLNQFAQLMAPALGIKPQNLQRCQDLLGHNRSSILILGLLEAGQRVQQPAAYFMKLIQKAEAKMLNIKRMFTSLTRKNAGFRPETAWA